MKASFFNRVRGPLFGGRLTQGQVDGMNIIGSYGLKDGMTRERLAYVYATVYWETARWMEPIREGARRYGTNYTDAQSRRAVAAIHAKGIIRRNYALPDENDNSFYGRGLVQITHKYNYAKFEEMTGTDLASNPDEALNWRESLIITFEGMKQGLFRPGNSLDNIVGRDLYGEYIRARDIINGDRIKNGKAIADIAMHFYAALESAYESV